MEFVELRKWNKSDAKALALHANNKRISDNLTDAFPYPYSLSDARSFISMALKGDTEKDLYLCIDVNGEPVGGIGIFVQGDVYRKSAMIGYWLAEEYWGKGIATESVKQVCAYAFENMGIVRIYAEVFSYNPASMRVLEKCGFNCEGVKKRSVYKNEKIHDSVVYALIKQDDR